MEECKTIAQFIDELEDNVGLEDVPNAIAREAFRNTNISCHRHLRLYVHVSHSKSKTRIAHFDIDPSKRKCRNSCQNDSKKKYVGSLCERGYSYKQTLNILRIVLECCKLPVYVPINIIPYPFEKENTTAHIISDFIQEDSVLEEDVHAHGLHIDEEKACVIDCNKNMKQRGVINKLFSKVLKPFFNENGKQFICHKKDYLPFSHHDLCRYAIPYMILMSPKNRRQQDFMKWSKEVAIRVCAEQIQDSKTSSLRNTELEIASVSY